MRYVAFLLSKHLTFQFPPLRISSTQESGLCGVRVQSLRRFEAEPASGKGPGPGDSAVFLVGEGIEKD